MDTKLVRLRPRQHLHDREQPIEAAAANPSLIIDEFTPDHGYLRNRATKGHDTEAQEAEEQARIAKIRRPKFCFVAL
jgi:hypothetical protein